MNWFLAFVLGFLVDIFYILWMWAAKKSKPWWGGTFALIIYIIGMINTLKFFEDKMLIMPLGVGYFFGSVLGIYWMRKHE